MSDAIVTGIVFSTTQFDQFDYQFMSDAIVPGIGFPTTQFDQFDYQFMSDAIVTGIGFSPHNWISFITSSCLKWGS